MPEQCTPKPHVPEGRPPGIEHPDGSDTISVGNICHVLQNERRRLTLNHLRDAEEPIRTGDLAEAVAAIENDTTPEQLNHSERKRVYISLYQVHLPTLDDAGIISYDSDRGIVETLPKARKLYEALDHLVDVTFPADSPVRKRDEPEMTPPPTHWNGSLLVAATGIALGVLVGFGIGSGAHGQVVSAVLGPVIATIGVLNIVI